MTKKATNVGKALEQQVANLYRQMDAWKVEHDVLMAGHQIDVCVEMAGPDRSLHRVAVEAKDWQSRVGIDVVRDWVLVVDDMRRAGLVDEGIIVSSRGFTKPAREAVAEHARRGLPVRLLELADLEAMVADAKTATRAHLTASSRPQSSTGVVHPQPETALAATSVPADVHSEHRGTKSLDARILRILHDYLQTHPGEPHVNLNELVGALGAERNDVILRLLGLREKGWLDYNLTEGAESGLVWLKQLGIKVAEDAHRN